MSFFKQFTNILQGSQAPKPVSDLEEFVTAWKKVQTAHANILRETEVHIDNVEVLKESKIRDNIKDMLSKLFTEDKNQARLKVTSAGPCLEYLLEQRVTEMLCTMGFADRPPGMKTLVLQTVRTMLRRIAHPLLPQMSVHAPIRQLIKVCLEVGMEDEVVMPHGHGASDTITSRVHVSLINLIETLWEKLEEDPSQLPFFYEPSGAPGKKPQITIVLALLTLLRNHTEVGDVARNSVVILSGISHPVLDDYLTKHCNFCTKVILGVVDAYKQLCDSQVVKDSTEKEVAEYNKNLKLLKEQLEFCDMIVRKSFEGHRHLHGTDISYPGTVILALFKKDFLEGLVSPYIMSHNEVTAAFATSNMVHMLDALSFLDHTVPGGQLLAALIDFLIGESLLPEMPASFKGTSTTTTTAALKDVKSSLLHRMDSLNDRLSITTMELFSQLLDYNDPRILHILVIRNLVDGNYLEPLPLESSDATSGSGSPLRKDEKVRDSDERLELARRRLGATPEKDRDKDRAVVEDELVEDEFDALTNHGSAKAGSVTLPVSATKIPHKKVIPPLDDSSQVQSFMKEFPNSPMPTNTKVSASFDAYLHDAQAKAISSLTVSERFRSLVTMGLIDVSTDDIDPLHIHNEEEEKVIVRSLFVSPVQKKAKAYKPAASLSPTDSSSSCTTISPAMERRESVRSIFYEGLFLETLFNRMEMMLDRSVEENLVLTEVLSKLAQSTVPSLHDYLFETVKLKSGVRSLKSVLKQLWDEARRRAGRIPDLDKRLDSTRVSLGVEGDKWDMGADGKKRAVDFDEDLERKKFLEAYVILEEFLKEIGCIAQAKEMVSFLQD